MKPGLSDQLKGDYATCHFYSRGCKGPCHHDNRSDKNLIKPSTDSFMINDTWIFYTGKMSSISY